MNHAVYLAIGWASAGLLVVEAIALWRRCRANSRMSRMSRMSREDRP